nr:hypothetical protein [Tanacetum cinerariifolium]
MKWWPKVDSMSCRLALKGVWRCRVLRGIQRGDEMVWLALELKGGDGGACGLLGNVGVKAIEQRDAKIASLISQLEKTKGEATKVISLCGWVSGLEVASAGRMKELAELGVKNAELLSHVSRLESLRDELKDQVSKLTSTCNDLKGEIKGKSKMREEFMVVHNEETQCIEKQNVKLDARKAISLAIDKGIQAGLEVGIEHDDLEALKDSPMELIMASINHKILLHDALDASCAGAKNGKKDASLSVVVVEPSVVASGLHTSSLAPTVHAPLPESHGDGSVIPTTA